MQREGKPSAADALIAALHISERKRANDKCGGQTLHALHAKKDAEKAFNCFSKTFLNSAKRLEEKANSVQILKASLLLHPAKAPARQPRRLRVLCGEERFQLVHQVRGESGSQLGLVHPPPVRTGRAPGLGGAMEAAGEEVEFTSFSHKWRLYSVISFVNCDVCVSTWFRCSRSSPP